ncbi:hypothetical protein SSP35_02_05370 [Streptomyces sp. NBRC 110611]|uniref:hypothetical protein n=1 Tax=Streptomyces sp. NBRC 110611 TaxID=1621259 RepID=UPI0008572867|nr:hypothetical protein [Streptomyces sp. NBRC 110611]GAU66168.1 hypothetical protein SSP35_02_05370 [Streptomyces sp. NBRC 110611]
MTSRVIGEERLNGEGVQQAFRTTKRLVGAYAGLSVLTLIALVLLRNHPDIATDTAWVRCLIVVATSLLMASFVARAARGHRTSFRRLRVSSGVMVAATAVIVALPGAFPVWLRTEQAVCGIILLGVVTKANGKVLRAVFAL